MKLLIVDDNQRFLDGIQWILRHEENINVVDQVLNGLEALKVIDNQTIDFIITDINMPEMDGVALTKIVKKEYPHIKVLVLSMYNDQETINELVKAKADGFMVKNTGKMKLIDAVRTIANNGKYYIDELAHNG